ncbi:4-hydroxy-2-oxoglutarate aldolase [Halalkalibacter hemicellulosilyticusJCM 9152]|uniref:4-hydroxy-2-oxoglutarate aldolase n=1 Tax=Halalkalibacter hemicellulosilyticusJCM 9152 TaxID=1236971 RepID=W4QL55_9BACI|nr:4-hydroxy-2-oxoglutarate aldolase [Halalkalibacter hemicellulosilyticusJCM 9152]
MFKCISNSIENAQEVFDAADGHVVVGVLSKNYDNVHEAIEGMRHYGKAIQDAVSIGLGAGDPKQAQVVAEIVKAYEGAHINQVFPNVGATRANLGMKAGWINSLVSPTGQAGFVNLSTGIHSSKEKQQAVVPIKSAIALIRDMGGNAIKYFPMAGLDHEKEYRHIAQACAEEGFALEPTGGIHIGNFERIIQIAVEEGVPIIIPHIYSSIIDKRTGNTSKDEVRKLTMIMKRVVDCYV